MMDGNIWQIVFGVAGLLIGIGTLLTPVVLAAMARDRQVGRIITEAKDGLRQDVEKVHDRVNRVRDEFVRRDDLAAHLDRIDKSFDQVRQDFAAHAKHTDVKFGELKEILASIKSQP